MATSQVVIHTAAGTTERAISAVPGVDSPFLRLPLEIRLGIYEQAALVDEPLRPVQVAPRSNKFVWGQYEARYPALKPTEPPLTAWQLSRTCRQVYNELDAYPVFYRVNRFEFRERALLIRFLAALTPKRRAAIRYVSLVGPVKYWDRASRNRSVKRKASSQPLLALLCQLTDLRQLELVVPTPPPSHLLEEPFNVREAIDQSGKLSADTVHLWALWHLPQFVLTFKILGDVEVRFRDRVRLFAPREALSYLILDRPPLGTLFQQIQDRLCSLRSTCKEMEENGQGMKSIVTDIMLRDALRASGLHFVGEDRLSLDLAKSSIVPISARTRNKSRGSKNPSEIGTIERYCNKYDAEGLLAWPVLRITDTRRDADGIQCKVVFSDDDEGSWEGIETLFMPHGLSALRAYYRDLLRQKHLDPRFKDAATSLKEMESVPMPKEVTKLYDEHVKGLPHEPAPDQNYVLNWERLQRKYHHFMSLLEFRAAILARRESQKKAKREMAEMERAKKRVAKKQEAKKRRVKKA